MLGGNGMPRRTPAMRSHHRVRAATNDRSVEGKTVGEIADLLLLSDRAIGTYRSRLLKKTRMKTTAELIHDAILNKLTE